VRVVATVPSLAAIVREVGGSCVAVQALAAATEDPHYVDAKPSFILALNRAQLLLATGLDLEVGWLPTLLVSARNGRIQPGGPGYLEAGRLVQLLEAPQGRIDRTMGDIHPGGNPHFLTDPMRVADVAAGVATRLGELDAAHADVYLQRSDAMRARLREVFTRQAQRFAALPDARRQVVTYHRSWSYLLAWLRLKEVATLEPRPGIAPDPGHVAGVLATMRRQKTQGLLQEQYYPVSTSRTLCRLAHARLVLLPGGVNFADNQDYVAFFEQLADTIYAAL
jgi:zinc/manganese transport system substrate-binding protein